MKNLPVGFFNNKLPIKYKGAKLPVHEKYIETHKDKDGSTYKIVRCYYKDSTGRTVYGDRPGMQVDCCPFCDTKVQGGSWMQDKCPKCKAVYFAGCWFKGD